jgi:hypothetical protein
MIAGLYENLSRKSKYFENFTKLLGALRAEFNKCIFFIQCEIFGYVIHSVHYQWLIYNRVVLSYDVMRGFCVAITQEYNVMTNSKELVGTTEYLTIQGQGVVYTDVITGYYCN